MSSNYGQVPEYKQALRTNQTIFHFYLTILESVNNITEEITPVVINNIISSTFTSSLFTSLQHNHNLLTQFEISNFEEFFYKIVQIPCPIPITLLSPQQPSLDNSHSNPQTCQFDCKNCKINHQQLYDIFINTKNKKEEILSKNAHFSFMTLFQYVTYTKRLNWVKYFLPFSSIHNKPHVRSNVISLYQNVNFSENMNNNSNLPIVTPSELIKIFSLSILRGLDYVQNGGYYSSFTYSIENLTKSLLFFKHLPHHQSTQKHHQTLARVQNEPIVHFQINGMTILAQISPQHSTQSYLPPSTPDQLTPITNNTNDCVCIYGCYYSPFEIALLSNDSEILDCFFQIDTTPDEQKNNTSFCAINSANVSIELPSPKNSDIITEQISNIQNNNKNNTSHNQPSQNTTSRPNTNNNNENSTATKTSVESTRLSNTALLPHGIPFNSIFSTTPQTTLSFSPTLSAQPESNRDSMISFDNIGTLDGDCTSGNQYQANIDGYDNDNAVGHVGSTASIHNSILQPHLFNTINGKDFMMIACQGGEKSLKKCLHYLEHVLKDKLTSDLNSSPQQLQLNKDKLQQNRNKINFPLFSDFSGFDFVYWLCNSFHSKYNQALCVSFDASKQSRLFSNAQRRCIRHEFVAMFAILFEKFSFSILFPQIMVPMKKSHNMNSHNVVNPHNVMNSHNMMNSQNNFSNEQSNELTHPNHCYTITSGYTQYEYHREDKYNQQTTTKQSTSTIHHIPPQPSFNVPLPFHLILSENYYALYVLLTTINSNLHVKNPNVANNVLFFLQNWFSLTIPADLFAPFQLKSGQNGVNDGLIQTSPEYDQNNPQNPHNPENPKNVQKMSKKSTFTFEESSNSPDLPCSPLENQSLPLSSPLSSQNSPSTSQKNNNFPSPRLSLVDVLTAIINTVNNMHQYIQGKDGVCVDKNDQNGINENNGSHGVGKRGTHSGTPFMVTNMCRYSSSTLECISQSISLIGFIQKKINFLGKIFLNDEKQAKIEKSEKIIAKSSSSSKIYNQFNIQLVALYHDSHYIIPPNYNDITKKIQPLLAFQPQTINTQCCQSNTSSCNISLDENFPKTETEKTNIPFNFQPSKFLQFESNSNPVPLQLSQQTPFPTSPSTQIPIPTVEITQNPTFNPIEDSLTPFSFDNSPQFLQSVVKTLNNPRQAIQMSNFNDEGVKGGQNGQFGNNFDFISSQSTHYDSVMRYLSYYYPIQYSFIQSHHVNQIKAGDFLKEIEQKNELNDQNENNSSQTDTTTSQSILLGQSNSDIEQSCDLYNSSDGFSVGTSGIIDNVTQCCQKFISTVSKLNESRNTHKYNYKYSPPMKFKPGDIGNETILLSKEPKVDFLCPFLPLQSHLYHINPFIPGSLSRSSGIDRGDNDGIDLNGDFVDNNNINNNQQQINYHNSNLQNSPNNNNNTPNNPQTITSTSLPNSPTFTHSSPTALTSPTFPITSSSAISYQCKPNEPSPPSISLLGVNRSNQIRQNNNNNNNNNIQDKLSLNIYGNRKGDGNYCRNAGSVGSAEGSDGDVVGYCDDEKYNNNTNHISPKNSSQTGTLSTPSLQQSSSIITNGIGVDGSLSARSLIHSEISEDIVCNFLVQQRQIDNWIQAKQMMERSSNPFAAGREKRVYSTGIAVEPVQYKTCFGVINPNSKEFRYAHLPPRQSRSKQSQ